MDIETGKVSDAVMITKGVRPLKFTEVKGIKSFVDGVYFGGYLSNPNKNSVSIYRRKAAHSMGSCLYLY